MDKKDIQGIDSIYLNGIVARIATGTVLSGLDIHFVGWHRAVTRSDLLDIIERQMSADSRAIALRSAEAGGTGQLSRPGRALDIQEV